MRQAEYMFNAKGKISSMVHAHRQEPHRKTNDLN